MDLIQGFKAKSTMAMNTMMDSTDSHLAQLVAEGSNMGITDSIKLLRDYENTSVSEEALGFAREVIKLEEQNLEVAKSFIYNQIFKF